ncbi:MAG: sugar transferase [Bacteroidota bacterium]|nr:sugar transferase [Bacteroidota bacterium]
MNIFLNLGSKVASEKLTKVRAAATQEEVISQPITTNNDLINALREEAGEEVLSYISEHFPLEHQETILFSTKQKRLYDNVNFDNIRVIINLEQANKHQRINSLLRSINTLLPDAGIYIGCVETYDIRWQKMTKRFGQTLTKLLWVFDFIFNRVMPRVKFTQKLYIWLTKNKYRVISLAETLGRLVYCGFDIIEFKQINNLMYFVVMKTSEPKSVVNISNGPFFPMRRVGRNGKLIKVYKLRTMHPYSEFLQDFVVRLNGYNHEGKPANDFRLTGWGKFFRKLWLDEIPQFINVFRGELGIVGVRPLSQFRFSQFPEDLKEERIKHKPGCIPPYVALNMPDALGNIEAERIYLNELKKNPTITNTKYFFMAVYNILTNKIRSA